MYWHQLELNRCMGLPSARTRSLCIKLLPPMPQQAWCTHVLPSLLEEAQASECSTVNIALYSLQSHSGVLAALLEVAFFHEVGRARV